MTTGRASDLTWRDRLTTRWKIKWGELIGPAECPMMKRWIIETPFGSIRLHHFYRPDVERDPHDHPWWFVTLVLRGGYDDVTLCWNCNGAGGWDALREDGQDDYVFCDECEGSGRMRDHLHAGSIRFRPSRHSHWVHTDDAWTIVVTGPLMRNWGFWTRFAGFVQHVNYRDYFAKYGYKPCPADDGDR